MKHFPRRTTEPTAEPLSVSEALAHLRVDEGEENDYVRSLIRTARMNAENRTERTLMPSTWTLRLDAFPVCDAGLIELRQPPVTAVTSVTYIDADGNTQTVPTADYVLDTFSEPGRLLPVDKWPLAASRPGAVTVVYTAGYASAAAVPAPIKHWMLLALTDLYELRQRSGEKPALPHDFADSLLAEYRVLGV
jgi:uncharacterized phiE125 gp8 family phage protein